MLEFFRHVLHLHVRNGSREDRYNAIGFLLCWATELYASLGGKSTDDFVGLVRDCMARTDAFERERKAAN